MLNVSVYFLPEIRQLGRNGQVQNLSPEGKEVQRLIPDSGEVPRGQNRVFLH